MRDGGARLAKATDAIRDAIAAASDIRANTIGPDDDLIEDLALEALELESLGLILEEIFALPGIPAELWTSPLYRTASALAEWCIRASDQAAWQVALNPQRKAGRK